MINKRPLEGRIDGMVEFEGNGSPMTYFTKGHVDKQEFATEVLAYCADVNERAKWYEWWDRFPYSAADVEHVYYRNVPAGRDFPGAMIMHRCDGPARGAYPITEIDIDGAVARSRRGQPNA
jgi:hypothetical protein